MSPFNHRQASRQHLTRKRLLARKLARLQDKKSGQVQPLVAQNTPQ